MAKKQNASTGEITEDSNLDIPDGKFHLKVYAPFQTYFEGNVFSISAVNDTGPFDILAKHHNFLTLISPCDLLINVNNDADAEKIKITRGIMQVSAKDVVVFLDV